MTKREGKHGLPSGHAEDNAIESGQAQTSGRSRKRARESPKQDRPTPASDKVEEATKESFPASDPPSYNR